MADQQNESGPPQGGPRPRKHPPIPLWKKALVLVSVFLMVGGLALKGYAHFVHGKPTPAPASNATNTGQPNAPSSARGFLPGSPRTPADATAQPAAEPQPGAVETWSPVLFRSGFSFFVGFCIAYVVRTFFKMVALVAGVALLAGFGLQYTGLINVDWANIESYYHTAADWIGVHTSGFRQFITAQLPSAALAATGFFIGFRRG